VACAKHFPGHGDTDVDSHLALPRVDHSRSRLEDVELRPFRMAIEARVAAIMTAHVLVPELDDQLPATLSPVVIEILLRRDMRFEGVIVSDDLEMKAIADRWPYRESALLAAKAGCDLLAACKSPDAQAEAIESLVRGVESEAIGFKEMEAACGRIRELKERFLLPYRDPSPREARAAAGIGERVALAEQIASRAGLHA
jgi:beta-N-acetylhexosaminidase